MKIPRELKYKFFWIKREIKLSIYRFFTGGPQCKWCWDKEDFSNTPYGICYECGRKGPLADTFPPSK